VPDETINNFYGKNQNKVCLNRKSPDYDQTDMLWHWLIGTLTLAYGNNQFLGLRGKKLKLASF
jgi:hypothetical protein